MKLVRYATLVAITLSLSSVSALAGPRNINRRQEHQQDRIYQGIKSGALTAKEAERLEAQQAKIDIIEARDRRSGEGLSAKERAQLEKDLNRGSKAIYEQKHDAQHRGGGK